MTVAPHAEGAAAVGRVELSVVVPMYREQAIVSELHSRLTATLEGLQRSYEIVLVDDGSPDGTWAAIRSLAARDDRVRGFRLSRNFGQHYAISAGIEAAQGDWVVVMDGDLQDLPETIPELLAKAEEGYDVVWVSRQQRPVSALYRLSAGAFYRLFHLLSMIPYDGSHGNFSIISRTVAESYCRLPENLRFYGGIIQWLGFRQASIPAPHGQRFAGPPAYNLAKRVRLATDILIAHSIRPLYASLGLGALMAFASVVFGIYILVRGLSEGFAVHGWASLVVIVVFTSGVVLMVLGIIGLYVGMIYREVKRRPLYVISDFVGLPGKRS